MKQGKLVVITDNGDYNGQGIIDDNLQELLGTEKYLNRKLDLHHPVNQVKFVKEIIEKVKLGESFTLESYSPFIIQAAAVFSKEIDIDYLFGELVENKLVYSKMNHNLNKIFSSLAQGFKELI
jgi:hypothetical protein